MHVWHVRQVTCCGYAFDCLARLGEHLRLRHTTFKPIVDVVVGGDVSLFVIVAVAMLLVWAHVICVGKISKRCMHCGL